jgi:hypothetical protein
LAVAAALLRPAGLWRWRSSLAACGVALWLFMAQDPGRLLMLNRGDRPTRVWTALSGEGDLGAYLPSLVTPDARDLRVLAIWVVALAALLALHAAASRRPTVDRAFRSLALPLLSLLATTVFIDRLTPASEKEPTEEVSVGSVARLRLALARSP